MYRSKFYSDKQKDRDRKTETERQRQKDSDRKTATERQRQKDRVGRILILSDVPW